MFKMLGEKDFEDLIKNEKISEPNKRKVYRLSGTYLFRSFIFISSLILLSLYIFKTDFSLDNLTVYKVITYVLEALVYLYIFYYIYIIFSYKVIVDSNYIIRGNVKIDVKNVESLEIKLARVANKSFERCLYIKTNDSKQYIFRLNISNRIKFIKQISILTNKEVIVKE